MKTDNWDKAKEIFGEALKLSPDERHRFLDQVCADDADTRHEVESLLASLDTAQSFLETPVAGEIAKVVEAEPKKLEKGTRFGHYEIVKMLGVGGMGEVYLANDKKLDRQVAIKILNEKFAKHESNLQRFTQEAKAASALNHPNILVIYEIGETEETNYIVSEFIEGKTLRDSFKESRMKLSEVLEISTQIVNALVAAHTAHIVHRDIKPENIMIRPDGYVKILDFGLAKLVEQKNVGLEDATAKQNQTAKGVIMGTVNYMSPEQAKGERVDERTDIFSLGAVIYEMISGRTPFAGNSMSETLANLINQEPQLLSRFAENIPNELQRIISKMLRKKKDERYQTMKGLLSDLKDLKENLTFEEKLERIQPSKDEKETAILQATMGNSHLQTAETKVNLWQKIKQHKSLAATALVILLVGILGYWFYTGRTTNNKQIESIAVMPFVNESGNAEVEYISDGMTERLISSLSQLPNLSVKARSSVFRYKGKETNPQTIGKELNVQAILTGRVVQRGDQLTLSLELVDVSTENAIWTELYNRKQSDLISLQSEIARDVSGKLKTKLSGTDELKLTKSYTADNEAYQLYLKGRFHLSKYTEDSLRRSIDYYNQAINRDPQFALAYSGLADAYISLGSDFAPPKEVMPEAKFYALKALELDQDLEEAQSSLGLVKLLWDWDWLAADRLLHPESEDHKAMDTFSCSLHYANTRGHNDDAIPQIERFLQRDPLSPVIKTELGCAYYYGQHPEQAIEEFRNALELNPNYPLAYFGLGRAYASVGRYDEAIDQLKKGRIATNHWSSIVAELAYCYAVSGKKAEARKVLSELQEQAKQKFVDPYLFALIYAGLNEPDQAFIWLEKAYDVRSSNLPWLNVEPQFNKLRGDSRFIELLKRIGFVLKD